MLYISAQPAEPYFVWQLEIQLLNFRELGIKPENIHVLIGYREYDSISSLFTHLELGNFAQFYYYKDTRGDSKYRSSIRPHLLKKHFEIHADLSDRIIFYHDCDIIFREKISEDRFMNDDNWYLSDTRKYLSASYLRSFGEDFFEGVCGAVKIDPSLVVRNTENSGGAQYIMKNLTASYWNDVETDSEIIYNFMNDYNLNMDNVNKVQSWCADMWSVLWNSWKRNITTRLSKELDFCWPKEHISRWYSTKILHNAGVFPIDKQDFFCKLLFKDRSPYFVDFSGIEKNSCSSIFVKKIEAAQIFQKKTKLSELTIIIHVKKCCEDSQKTIETYLRYILKYLDVRVIVFGHISCSLFNKEETTKFNKYYYRNNDEVEPLITKEIFTKYFLYIDSIILLPVENIIKAYRSALSNSNSLIVPYSIVNLFHSRSYERWKDQLNIPRKNDSLEQSYGNEFAECFIMGKEDYIKTGGENLAWEFYINDGFNLERESRVRMLGFKIFHTEGVGYRLFNKTKGMNEPNILSESLYHKRITKGSSILMLEELKSSQYSHQSNKQGEG
jgi:hypothetical protein